MLSLPGSGRHRIKPGETGFDNLVIAGDWTDCGLNAGCVEAAVMSGRLAAHAVSGSPSLEDIVGYRRPRVASSIGPPHLPSRKETTT